MVGEMFSSGLGESEKDLFETITSSQSKEIIMQLKIIHIGVGIAKISLFNSEEMMPGVINRHNYLVHFV